MAVAQIVLKSLEKVFGSRNARILKKLARTAEEVERIEAEARALNDEELRAKTDEFKQRIREGEEAEDLMGEAFAVLREASRRAAAHRHFNCQLVGGQVLYDGQVAEMKTGEGKTIVCHLAAYLRVLAGMKVHIVTVNDYLVRRDAEFAGPIFEMLGVSVGYIQSQLDPSGAEGIRKQAYASDITYGTTSEFGFDYLRDNMKIRHRDQVQGRLDYAIVDEVDSILIDEARTPLIISGGGMEDEGRYKWADGLARFLVRKQQHFNRETADRIAKEWGNELPEQLSNDAKAEGGFKRFKVDPYMVSEDEAEAIGHRQCFVVQRDRKAVSVTHEGIALAQDEAGIGSFYVGDNMDRPHLIEQALRAHVVYERDKDYVVQNREVIIVDENTGRLMIGRQWSDGLHQAVEAKEGVPIKQETQTLATITVQNFFKLYDVMAGMTGTAATEADEFLKIYKLDVVEIPTNRPVNRVDHNDKMYRNEQQKFAAIVDEIYEVRRRGRPRDPFLIADVLTALRPIASEQGGDTSRIDEAMRQFNSAEEGDEQVVDFMLEVYDEMMADLVRGKPVLVGTTSVEKSEKLSGLLERTYGIEHEVLNAKNHAREADIVAKAGHQQAPARGHDKRPVGNVTVATNMAGRGTDIKLAEGVVHSKCKVPDESAANALYPAGVTKCCINCEEYDPATNCAHCFKPKIDPRFPAMGRKVCSLNAPCGLHIVGTERHEARRIDNQLRGRSGRQGDPGSSRFFISLEDDLVKLFMPDWMLKMMEKLGFTEGASIEDKRLNKGIERAQRKVEERNFSSRKHLLEWDEPMDYQRKEFYGARQRILEGRGLESLIFRTIDNSISESVSRFLARNFREQCIADWCRSVLDLQIDPKVLDVDDPETTQDRIRETGKNEARETIRTTLIEYIDPEADPVEWDLGEFVKWADRSYGFRMTQNQLRKMAPAEIEDALTEAAEKHFDEVDLSGIEAYLDDAFGRRQLCEWARNKFEIEVDEQELIDRPRDAVIELFKQRVRQAYHEREIAYPVEQCMVHAFADATSDNAQACEIVCRWAKVKYGVDWSVELIQGRPGNEIARRLLALQRDFLENGKMEAEVDRALATHDGDELTAWAKSRFRNAWDPEKFETSSNGRRDVLLDMGRRWIRYELSMLEQHILLRIFDQAWKDHLLEMDRLKHAIMQRPMGGDQTHPQSQYAIEGREFFDQMWSLIRTRVTDIIFKLRAAPPASGPTVTSARPSKMQMMHADATNAAFAGAASDQQSAMQAQRGEQKVETIRREAPKVKRNDPCPCGSGKKYKQCHGRAG
jgi:preprotein translocase subunit SecA